MNELPKRLRAVNSEGVVSKRAATDVSVSRSPTVYEIVGTIGAGPVVEKHVLISHSNAH